MPEFRIHFTKSGIFTFALVLSWWKCLATDDYRMAALDAHNKFRANHGAQPLVMDVDLNYMARQQAELMAASNKIIIDTKDNLYGESVNRASATNDHKRMVELSIRQWYQGIKWFEFGSGPPHTIHPTEVYGFLQIVWNHTDYRVGFGLATHEGKTKNESWTYFAAYYSTPIWEMDYMNVSKPISPIDPIFERASIPGKSFLEVATEVHNKYRDLHRAPPIVPDYTLSTVAHDWAMVLAKEHDFNPRQSPQSLRLDSGQNVFGLKDGFYDCDESGIAKQVEQAIDIWFNTVINYNFGEPGLYDNPEALGFSQVVWRSAQKFGIGYYKLSNDTYQCVIVVNYWPEIGSDYFSYQRNVLPQVDKNPINDASYYYRVDLYLSDSDYTVDETVQVMPLESNSIY